MPVPDIPRDELRAAVEARRELGPELEAQVIEGFLDRIERTIDARVDARVEARLRAGVPTPRTPTPSNAGAIVLGVLTGAIGIGATGTATAFGEPFGFLLALAAWGAIVLINLAYRTR